MLRCIGRRIARRKDNTMDVVAKNGYAEVTHHENRQTVWMCPFRPCPWDRATRYYPWVGNTKRVGFTKSGLHIFLATFCPL